MKSLKRATGIIPARYHSSRFPGKPLALICGKPMIQMVYEQTLKASLLERIIIATDDERIRKCAEDFGAEVWMTAEHHSTGTERVAEVAEKIKSSFVVNIQCDEPLLEGEMIDALVESLEDFSVVMTSLMAKVTDTSLISDPNKVKVVVDKNNNALYFSRAPLPFDAADFFYLHIGIYGYKRDFLLEIPKMPPTRLEKAEKLEQLRILENGFKIRMKEVDYPTLSVDTPEDIIKVEDFLRKRGHE